MEPDDLESRISGLSCLIGNTPLLCIKYRYKGKVCTTYAKAENLNMTGSIKDRMAFYIIQQGYKRGTLKAGDTIVEATSGNTGIAFSAIGRALGHPVLIFMPEWMSEERSARCSASSRSAGSSPFSPRVRSSSRARIGSSLVSPPIPRLSDRPQVIPQARLYQTMADNFQDTECKSGALRRAPVSLAAIR